MYCIIRNYFDAPSSVVCIGLSEEGAQAHCRDESTHGAGWFDGYTLEDNRRGEVDALRAEGMQDGSPIAGYV